MDDNIQKFRVKNKIKKKKIIGATNAKNLENNNSKLDLKKKKKKKLSTDKKIAHKISDDDSETVKKKKKKKLSTDKKIAHKGSDDASETEISEFSDDDDSDDMELKNDVDKYIKSLNFERFAAHDRNVISSSKNEVNEIDVLQLSKAKKLKKVETEVENQAGSSTTMLTGNKAQEKIERGKDSKFEKKMAKILKKSKEKNKFSKEDPNLNSDPSSKIKIDSEQAQGKKNKKVNETKSNLGETTRKESKITKRESADKESSKCVKDTTEGKKNEIMEKLKKQLQSASFRLINEQLYTSSGTDAYQMFQKDPDSFKVYHDGYSQQVSEWPVQPLNLITAWLRKKPRNWVIADFGCGKAILAKSIKQKVHSLDLIASAPNVIKCDMAHTPLESESVDVAVFCLSLMGTNLTEFIVEANRVLVNRGVLKIAEIESRFENNVNKFLKVMLTLGFRNIHKNQNQNYFWLFDFIKIKSVKLKPNLPELELKPCMYKKR